jgi:8-oxo-dGTP pyrophosphatase MutT (NUDIX family)
MVMIHKITSSYFKGFKKQKTYGAILIYKDKYALVQGRYTGKWSFPKGHSNEGEKPIECTKREVEEETGISTLPEPTGYIKVGYGRYFVFNLMEQIELRPIDTNEIINTTWVTLKEMENLDVNSDVRQYIKK